MIDSTTTLEILLTAYHLPYVSKNMFALFNYNKILHIHSLHVATLAIQVGEMFGLSKEQLTDMAAGALLHDIGKLDISNDIWDKHGKLTGPEFNIVKKHPEHGFLRLIDVPHPAIVDYIILFHHYKNDFTGYPSSDAKEFQDFFRILREDFPLEVQIVTACDVFCALTTIRPYKRAFSPRKALYKMKRMNGLNETVINEITVLVRDNMLLLNTAPDAFVFA